MRKTNTHVQSCSKQMFYFSCRDKSCSEVVGTRACHDIPLSCNAGYPQWTLGLYNINFWLWRISKGCYSPTYCSAGDHILYTLVWTTCFHTFWNQLRQIKLKQKGFMQWCEFWDTAIQVRKWERKSWAKGRTITFCIYKPELAWLRESNQ